VNRYLIFRTDRIGDFLITAILLKSIKKNDPSAHITLIASDKNFSYIETFPYVNQVIKLENTLLSKLLLFFKLIKVKYKNIIVHDNKKRSKLISFFLKSKKKIYLDDTQNISHIQTIKKILLKMNFNYSNDSLNILDHRKINQSNDEKYIQLHFDEKWIFKDYIDKYINIQPTENELINFFVKLIKKNKKKLIITTGFELPKIMKNLKPFLAENKVKIYENLNFFELERITSHSKLLISCHGAISHVAAANNIRQIDVIDKSYNYAKWTDHFRNYNYLHRVVFKELSQKIIEIV
jgi:ADP-heptose:LPS heptosyltransferase